MLPGRGREFNAHAMKTAFPCPEAASGGQPVRLTGRVVIGICRRSGPGCLSRREGKAGEPSASQARRTDDAGWRAVIRRTGLPPAGMATGAAGNTAMAASGHPDSQFRPPQRGSEDVERPRVKPGCFGAAPAPDGTIIRRSWSDPLPEGMTGIPSAADPLAKGTSSPCHGWHLMRQGMGARSHGSDPFSQGISAPARSADPASSGGHPFSEGISVGTGSWHPFSRGMVAPASGRHPLRRGISTRRPGAGTFSSGDYAVSPRGITFPPSAPPAPPGSAALSLCRRGVVRRDGAA